MTETTHTEPVDPRDALFNSIVEATFVEETDDGAIFTFGDGDRVLVPAAAMLAKPGEKTPVATLLEGLRGKLWLGSQRKADALAGWDAIEALVKSKEIVEVDILAANDGGLVVDVLGMRGFVPRSQVDLYKVDDLSQFVGTRERMLVIKLDEKDGNIVLSRRRLLEDERKESRGELLAKIEVGQVHEGIVRRVMPYGAFVDIGGIEGLLHSSNIAWGRDEQKLAAGDVVKVKVLDFDEQSGKLGLGRKQLLDDPWVAVLERFSIGSVCSGSVVSLRDFGAFVALADGIEGLVHTSEISWTERVGHPRNVLTKGQEVQVKVLDINLEDRRIRLSIKRLESSPWETLAQTHKSGDRITVKVARITDFGLFVELAPNADGLVHINDISWTERVDDLNERYKPGDEIEVAVLSIDPEQGRASLGVKQLADDPWASAARIARPGEKIEVVIQRVTDFGAFAQVVEGVEGLIHISELSEERVERAEDIVKPGQTVEVLVLAFDTKRKRISLSLKREALEVAETNAEYQDEEGATAVLGDIFPAALRKSAEPVAVSEEPTASAPSAAADAPAPDAAAESADDVAAESADDAAGAEPSNATESDKEKAGDA